ncbi:AMP-binding protein [Cytobacillus firmus]|uniref:AMP-binding protein n=1 Tax=Cytobacillus firmus TaxID=1399 RepID=UPI0018CD4128|nr:AMP-binding protein [Cytobacillus firmus]MBG9590196.1 hypothetical protein [Cytobacillus firmus]
MSHSKQLSEFFFRSSKRFGERHALFINEENILTYSQVEVRAKVLGSFLINKNSKKIGVFASKSEISYISILAINLIGSTYIPLNPQYNVERNISMIELSGLDTIIVDNSLIDSMIPILKNLEHRPTLIIPNLSKRERYKLLQFVLDENIVDDFTLKSCEPLNAEITVNPNTIAYILFTSGSTGKPKGVPISYKNIISYLQYKLERYELNENDRFTQIFEHTFDLSLFDIYMCWSTGGCLFPMNKWHLLNPIRFLNEHNITVWFSVPSVISLLKKLGKAQEGCLPNLRYSLFCGEALAVSNVMFWKTLAPNSIIENLYGPTEATISCSHYRIEDNLNSHNGIVSIGNIHGNLKYILIDDEGMPNVLRGQLCVHGPQVFDNYLNEEDGKGVIYHHKNSMGITERYYKTGDMIEVSSNGDLFYIGRLDSQIQVNGHRIELGEVEAAFIKHDRINQVCAIGYPQHNEIYNGIAVFISGDITLEEIKEKVNNDLPFYMLPKEIIILDELPLNDNGKVNKSRLKNYMSERVGAH